MGSSGSFSAWMVLSAEVKFGGWTAVAAAMLCPAKPRARAGLAALAAGALLLAGHCLSVNSLHAEARDIYMGATVQVMPFDPGQAGA